MGRPATGQPAAGPSATLTDEDLREVAAGAAHGIGYRIDYYGLSPRSAPRVPEGAASLVGGLS